MRFVSFILTRRRKEYSCRGKPKQNFESEPFLRQGFSTSLLGETDPPGYNQKMVSHHFSSLCMWTCLYNFWSWFSFLRDAGLRMYHYFGDFVCKKLWLKELYTSETTLAQKIVLTTLNNELKLEIWNSTSFMLKNRPIFLKKIYNNQFLASWRGPMVFMYINKVFYFHI